MTPPPPLSTCIFLATSPHMPFKILRPPILLLALPPSRLSIVESMYVTPNIFA